MEEDQRTTDHVVNEWNIYSCMIQNRNTKSKKSSEVDLSTVLLHLATYDRNQHERIWENMFSENVPH